MASKAQREAVHTRAAQVHANIGTFHRQHPVSKALPSALIAALGVNALAQSEPVKPLSADPDLYLATMVTETSIQRDMVLDMLHNKPE